MLVNAPEMFLTRFGHTFEHAGHLHDDWRKCFYFMVTITHAHVLHTRDSGSLAPTTRTTRTQNTVSRLTLTFSNLRYKPLLPRGQLCMHKPWKVDDQQLRAALSVQLAIFGDTCGKNLLPLRYD